MKNQSESQESQRDHANKEVMPEQERGEHNRVPSVWGQGGPLSHDGEAIEG